MEKFSIALIVLAFGIIISSCNDPSPVGAELLEEDQVDVFYTDSMQMIASTVREDSILTFDPNPSILNDNFLFGHFSDPVFGRTEAGIYAQLVLDFESPDFEDAIVDSMVLTLQYDSENVYGDLEAQPFGLEVYRITEDVDREAEFFSNSSLEVGPSPLVEFGPFVPQIEASDSITGIVDYRFDDEGDIISTPAGLRVRMSTFLAAELINYDSTVYSSNTNFVDRFQGLYIKPTRLTSGVLSFNLASTSSSGLTIYYRQDTSFNQYTYEFSTRFVQFNSIEHNFEFSPVDAFFDDPVLGDSLLFAQAMAGPNIKIELPELEQFEGAIVNKADLEFTVAMLDVDDPNTFFPLDILVATDRDDDGNFFFVSDALTGTDKFGGDVQIVRGPDGEKLLRYTMNLSSHMQEMIDGNRPNNMFIRAFPKQERAGRTVIYGPGHSKYPMKLSMTYTKL